MEIKTSLEAFNKIVDLCNYYRHKLTNSKMKVKTIYGYPIDNIRKELEVLELLKKRQVELKFIKASKDYIHYVSLVVSHGAFFYLYKREYDLIKEWLENEN